MERATKPRAPASIVIFTADQPVRLVLEAIGDLALSDTEPHSIKYFEEVCY